MTLRMGKRGTLVIPKAIREECKLVEGTQMEVSLENRAIVLLPSVSTRTRMDDNFDEARAILSAGGVTLEMALAKLTEIKARTEQSQETEADERPVAA
jgi:AbrB family looped-hinge helix DNA binding protein